MPVLSLPVAKNRGARPPVDPAIFQAIVENAVEAIVTVGPDGRVRMANASVERIFGWPPHELVGRNIRVLMRPEDAAAHDGHMSSYLAGRPAGIVGIGRDLSAVRRDGTPVTIHLSVARVEQDGAPLFVGIMRDITEETRARMALEEAHQITADADRAKTEFLGKMSHELRTPLNAIIGFAEVLESEMFGPLGAPAYHEYAKLIWEGGHRLLSLFNDILEMTRIETGQVRLDHEPVDLPQLFAACARAVQDSAASHRLSLHIDLPDDIPPAVADPRALRQVLLNLLSNAIKFTPEGGRITLSAHCLPDGATEIAVTDTGIGIEEHLTGKVLLPFVQGDPGLARRYEGAGLGLPIAKSLVEMHGGELKLDSRPGEGTRAAVRLPAAANVNGGGPGGGSGQGGHR